jgi:hypothetical protein
MNDGLPKLKDFPTSWAAPAKRWGVGRDIHVRFARSQDYQLDELAKFIETVG